VVLTSAALLLCCGGEGAYRPLRIGDPVPAYTARRLEATDSLTLASLHGQPVLVNVWATWCVPCRAEMPALQALAARYEGRGLRVLGINIDAGSDDAPVRAFLDELAITFPNLRDPQDRITRVFRLSGVPETVLIGRDGRIAHRWIGRFDPLSDESVQRVRVALPGT
jgi:thiol-disulfide isomerase/thioredoxin